MSAGHFVLNREVFDYIGGDDCIFQREPLEQLALDGQLMAYRHDGFFCTMDTYREYRRLSNLWRGGNAPWRVWGMTRAFWKDRPIRSVVRGERPIIRSDGRS